MAQLQEGEHLIYIPENQRCVVANIPIQAGGVSGVKNTLITVQFIHTDNRIGDVRTFPLEMADVLLRRITRLQPTDDGEPDVEETNEEEETAL